ncbi:MAG: hypothetical protein AAF724_02495 [Pseudomonadota bacterium]
MLRQIYGVMRKIWTIIHLWLRNRGTNEPAVGELPVVLSSTTHGDRVRRMWIALESVARGSAQPTKNVVWLDNSYESKALPHTLERLKSRGVTFCFAEDVGPHQKYYYSVDEAIRLGIPLVTMDDDTIYSTWWLRRLFDAHLKSPNCVVCYRARLIDFTRDGRLRAYDDWPFCNIDSANPRVFFTGVSGVLYPLSFLETVKEYGDAFKEQCPKADDVWLNYIAASSNYPVRQIFPDAWGFPTVPMTQHMALWSNNRHEGNDEQLLQTYDRRTLSKLL